MKFNRVIQDNQVRAGRCATAAALADLFVVELVFFLVLLGCSSAN